MPADDGILPGMAPRVGLWGLAASKPWFHAGEPFASIPPNAGHHLAAERDRKKSSESIVNLWWRVRCMAVLYKLLTYQPRKKSIKILSQLPSILTVMNLSMAVRTKGYSI
jgi:hypothetical protein